MNTKLDPVICIGKEWFFYDEVWSDLLGPYDTEKEAREKLTEYVRYLNKL